MDIRNELFDIHIMNRSMQADIMAKSKHSKSEIREIVFHCFVQTSTALLHCR